MNLTYSWPTVRLPLEGHRVQGQGQPQMTQKILFALLSVFFIITYEAYGNAFARIGQYVRVSVSLCVSCSCSNF